MWKHSLVLACALLAGCAAGGRYNYRDQPVTLPMRAQSEQTLMLTVEDARPYVLSGEKAPSFVGLQRGGYGNPFDVNTTSGSPLTEDMSVSIAKGLENAGYTVVTAASTQTLSALVTLAGKNSASRILWLKVKEWKSDIFMSIGLTYDLQLSVYDAKGELLGEDTLQGDGAVGGGKLSASKNSEHMSQEFRKRIGYLFNSPKIRPLL